MKLLDKFLGNPLLYILIGAVAGASLVVGGIFGEIAILTLGGLVLGFTVGGVVIVYIALVLCLGLMR